ncbi:hypothetical protein ACM39_10940 [Chryseobacterium sp. FH2]|uniref:hypothetical protein n=1 Tax=Chryseobacterium sp. FH2 TaxID=1674291 RepID=UPI00065AE8D9|nr:hypothetical protein [Chryseobacterium sp. FH2]KMQ67850.1 hypothetical protein ACM39_10940 [Chryseobacterium sp. FH2]
MAEELYFLKTNPVIAKINLYNKLCREEQSALTFMNDDQKTSLELIKKKVQESSIESLTKEELLCLFSWFNNQYQPNNEEIKNQLFINGLDLFYEIPANADVKKFQQILSDYEKISQKNLNYILNAESFNQFLIYGIFYTSLIQKEKREETILSDYLKSDNKTLYSLAENQFNAKTFEADPALSKYFSDLYDATKFYKGTIIKLDK